jgi:hypothetical protein
MTILKKVYSYRRSTTLPKLYIKNDEDRRFFSILRRGGLYNLNPKDIKVSRAFSTGDLFSAYALVHDQYTAKKYIQPKTIGIRIRIFELSKNIATFVVKKNNKIIGVCSLIIDSLEIGLPCDKIYPDEVRAIRQNSELICEATNEALHKEYYSNTALTELLRCILAHALYKGCEKILIEVSKSHKRFYELNYFDQIGSTKNYCAELYDPVILMCSDLKKLVKTFLLTNENTDSVNAFMRKFYYTQNPYINFVKAWDLYQEMQIKNTIRLIETLQRVYRNTEYCKDTIKKKLFSTAFSK